MSLCSSFHWVVWHFRESQRNRILWTQAKVTNSILSVTRPSNNLRKVMRRRSQGRIRTRLIVVFRWPNSLSKARCHEVEPDQHELQKVESGGSFKPNIGNGIQKHQVLRLRHHLDHWWGLIWTDGRVFKGKKKDTGEIFALKVMKKSHLINNNQDGDGDGPGQVRTR